MPSDAEFLELMRGRHDDLELRRVYGDWLQAAGNPRGELVSLQVAAQTGTNDYQKRKFSQLAKALLKQHPEALLGPAEQDELFSVDWFCGFIDTLANRLQRRVASGRAVVRHFAAMLDHPSSALLRKLQLRPSDAAKCEQLAEAIHGHVPADLEELSLLTGEVTAPAAERLYAAAPNIRELRCHALHLELGRIRLPRVRDFTHHFVVMGSGVTEDHLRSYRDAEWPMLESMSFNAFVAAEAALHAFFSPAQLPALRRLSVGVLGYQRTPGVATLLRWPIIGQLEELSLSGMHQPAEIAALLDAREALRPAARLNVDLPDWETDESRRLQEAFGSRLHISFRPGA